MLQIKAAQVKLYKQKLFPLINYRWVNVVFHFSHFMLKYSPLFSKYSRLFWNNSGMLSTFNFLKACWPNQLIEEMDWITLFPWTRNLIMYTQLYSHLVVDTSFYRGRSVVHVQYIWISKQSLFIYNSEASGSSSVLIQNTSVCTSSCNYWTKTTCISWVMCQSMVHMLSQITTGIFPWGLNRTTCTYRYSFVI